MRHFLKRDNISIELDFRQIVCVFTYTDPTGPKPAATA